MKFTSAPDERAALQFDDLASALDAGLPLASLGGDPSAGERTVHGILKGRGIQLSAAEDAVLTAAHRAGRIGTALRTRAEQRRLRSQFRRDLWAGLRYPLLVLIMAFGLSLLFANLLGDVWLPLGVGLLLLALAAAGFTIYRGLQSGGEKWQRLPWLGPLARGLGELPYLETLHALYAAGVPVIDAHAQATATVAVATLRIRLRHAEHVLRDGRSLGEALMSAAALHEETRQLLVTGEQSGQLESALERALMRRRDVTTRQVKTSAQWAGHALYAVAVVSAVTFVVRFYMGYFAMLRG